MKRLRALAACALILNCMRAFGGAEQSRVATATEEFNPQRFEFAIESAFLFGAINPPASYEIAAELLTARVRWGAVSSESCVRGYHQFYVSAVLERVFRGIAHHHFG